MKQSTGKYLIYRQASLGQKLAFKIPIYQRLAGTDPETSKAIGYLLKLGDHGLIDLKTPAFSLILDLLDVERQALFATSEKVNEITKMSMQMPKQDEEIDFDEMD